MQCLFTGSEESEGIEGLGVIDAKVKRLRTTAAVPHIGWNTVRLSKKEECKGEAAERPSSLSEGKEKVNNDNNLPGDSPSLPFDPSQRCGMRRGSEDFFFSSRESRQRRRFWAVALPTLLVFGAHISSDGGDGLELCGAHCD